ncbi:MAG TPA: FAD-dependent oxidoreductase [Gemmatimonadota bacterium]|nr:FAD-dependent oxidoreductase [Gemmatimonadota bacterium]
MGPETAQVVIVGGGVVGASAAWHLTRLGCRDVLVLERGKRAGEGSTGRATGGFRAQFGTPVNVRLSLLAREKLLAFEDETGVDPGYEPHGYLFLAGGEESLDALRRALGVQRGAGLLDSREVDRREIAALNPALRLDEVIGATFCPTDGFIRPLAILRGYLEAAARSGVRIRYGESCRKIRVEPRGDGSRAPARVTGVRTERGDIATPAVVDAAGAWAAEVASLAGAALPVRPERRQVAATAPFDGLPAAMPMTIFADDGFHLRVRDGRTLLLWPRESRSSDPFDTRFDPKWLDGLMDLAVRRVPCLARTAIDPGACRAGLYEMSPDRHAILGESPEVKGLYYACGSSGHGIMHAPALGQLLAEIVLDGEASSLDVRALRPSRFDEGDPNPEAGLL